MAILSVVGAFQLSRREISLHGSSLILLGLSVGSASLAFVLAMIVSWLPEHDVPRLESVAQPVLIVLAAMTLGFFLACVFVYSIGVVQAWRGKRGWNNQSSGAGQ